MVKGKRKWILLTAMAVTLPALLSWLLPFPGSFLRTGSQTAVNVSSAELLSIFERNAAEFRGPALLNLLEAVKNPAYLKMRWRLFVGQKLSPMVTTNASLSELAAAFAIYSNCRGLIVPGELQEIAGLRFGKFDSGDFAKRGKAAGAIVKLLGDAGWHVVQLTDGKVAFVSENNYKLLLAAKSPTLQERLLQQFDHAKDLSQRQSPAQILSRLWRVGFLSDRIKEQVVAKHCHLVLRQHTSVAYPSWDVKNELTFPFPGVWTDFTPTLYRNDQVKWSPGRPQLSRAMNAGGDPITSMSGGEFQNGDVLQCKIELTQKIDGRVWRMNLWTPKIVLQGLKH